MSIAPSAIRRPRAAPPFEGGVPAGPRLWRLQESVWQEATRAARLWGQVPDSPLLKGYPLVRECLASARWEGVSPTLVEVLGYRDLPQGPRIRARAKRVECLRAAHEQISGHGRGLAVDEERLHTAYTTVTGSEVSPVDCERDLAAAERPVSASLARRRRLDAARSGFPVLVRTALDAAQLIRRRPYRRGNGRMARLLVQDDLICSGVLDEPILFLSEYLSRTRGEGARILGKAERAGVWEGWVDYFLTGLLEVAADSAMAADRVLNLVHMARIQQPRTYRGEAGKRLLDYCLSEVPCSLESAMAATGLPRHRVRAAWKRFLRAGWLRPATRSPHCTTLVFQPLKEVLLDTDPFAED